MVGESTTIDSILIEVQTDSADASRSLEDLAKSLGELKKNGAFKTVSKNLEALGTALGSLPNVYKASNSLRTLANSIQSLKEVGSVASLANSLKKLPEALNKVGAVDLDYATAKIEELARAVTPLTQIKASGFSSMVNSMAKIDKVTASLDSKKIEQFADKMKELNKAIEPFATKMGTIATAFKGLNTAIKQTNVTVDRANAKVNVSVFNFANLTQVLRDVLGAVQNVAKGFANVVDMASQWDGIAARFGRGFGEQAQETYAWVKKLNEEMSINIQQFMQYSSVYATMLTGFGVANEDASKMALGYAELTYDIWAGYNDIYKTFDEAAEAVRSAIAGEVEPVRRAGFTIVEATLQETAANHGLAISLETATEAQKSYLRYLTLVDQAHKQGLVGTYAKEMNTAEGVMRTLSQQVKSLAQAFGSLFIPVLVKVIPWVQAIVELLTEAVYWIAALFGIELQEISWDSYNSSASDAVQNTDKVTDAVNGATDAIEKMKNATIGIDELNVISPSSATGGGGSGAGGAGGGGFDDLDVDSLWDESIFKNIESQIDEIKEKLKAWLPVLEVVGAAFGTLGIALLIAQLGEAMDKISKMPGMVGTLQKALAGLTILSINAVLTFMLADDYLESGNLLNLVGEALVTATSGYLMYKGFGAKGLAMSLAVSIIAQLAAVTLNLATGGVEISDPELWIQSAFTAALGGASGGILAYKGLIKTSVGKGIGFGLLAGVSLTLAAITIGQVASEGKVDTASILTGIGSVLSAAGFGFMVGGPWGAAIGAAVGLTINVVGAAVGAMSASAKKSVEKDLKSRFGEIELTIEEVQAYIENITAIPREVTLDAKVWNELTGDYEVQTMTVPVDVAFEIFDTENAVLDNLLSKANNIAEGITRDAMKIMLGIEISHEDYQANIESYVNEAQAYLDQYYLTTSIAIAVSSGDSSQSLTSTLNAFYSTSSAELETLGAKLKKTVSEAFVDGEWIPDKLQEALDLQKEIQDILDYTADVEFRATLENLKLEVTGTDLTPESFNNVISGAKDAIEKKLKTLEEVKMSKLQVAVMQYDANIKEGLSEVEAKKIYDSTVADIEAEYQKGKIEVSYGTVDFGLDTIREAFAKELESNPFNFGEMLSKVLADEMWIADIIDEGHGDRYTGIDDLVNGIYTDYAHSIFSINPEVRKNMESLLAEMTPTMADYKKIAEDSRKAGVTVPQNVRDGMNDYKELEALSGSGDAINYMIGQKFATDPVFLNTLATAKNAGSQIDDSVAEGLLNNLTYVTDEATGLVTGIKNSITGEVITVTPTLVDNMKQLGVDLSTGLGEGVEKDEPSLWQKFTSWCGGIVDWVKGLFDSHSPSRVFMEIGKDLSDGLALGMETNSLKNRVTTMWTTAKEWWDNNKPSLKTYTPSIGDIKTKVSSAWTTAKTWWDNSKSGFKTYTPSIGSIYEKAKVRWDNAREWYNEKKKGFSQYTPSIGSIYEKAKVRWDNAREWYNEKKKGFKQYTPSIGSIKDKVVSAFNSAKKWWNSNASLKSLSTKLNVSVPKIEVKWKTAEAFGKSFKYPTGFNLKFAANGGIFDQGSLIWAGERGPEVMATATGGKTGVMNVEQMQEAVYEGVYAAITAAMGGKSEGGAQAVNVYLDGRQITAAVEQRQRERGASIMGNEVYSY